MRVVSSDKASGLGTALLILLLAMTSLLPTGCASQSVTMPQGEPSAAKTTPATLKVGTTRQIKSSNPVSDYWYGVLGGFLTQESLVRIDPQLSIKPGLAEKWEVSDQARVWKFHITNKARWHDGHPVTVEDVKFSIDYRMAKDPQSAWMKDVLESVDIEGDAVVLRLNKPYSTLLTEFDTYRILPKHVWEKVEDPLQYTGQDATLGCGPYQLDRIDLNAGNIVFKANADYFEGKPAIDVIEFSVYRNVDAMTMALAKGDIDITWDYSASLPYTSLPPLTESADIEIATEIDLGVPVALGFNLKRSPTSERVFRQAISYAIDYAKLAELVFVGYGRIPTSAFVPASMPNHNASLNPLQQDIKKAGELLDSIGVKDVNGDGTRENTDGTNLELTILSRTDSDVIARSAELLQGYLKSVGVASRLRALDTATWTSTKDNMDYDLVLLRTTPWGMMMHAGYASGYFDSRRTGAGVLHNVDDPAYLALCDQILSTTDEDKTTELQTELQEYYAQELPAIALAWADIIYPYNSRWEGWQVDVIHGGPVNRYSLFTTRLTK